MFFSYKLTGYPPISKSKDPNTNIFGQTSHKAKLKIDIKSKYYYNTLAEFINLVANLCAGDLILSQTTAKTGLQ